MSKQVTLNDLRNKLLLPPVFPGNDEKNQQARVLYVTIWTIITMAGIVFIGNILGGRTPPAIHWVNGFLIAALILMYYQMQKGNIQFASIGALVVGFIHITIGIAVLGTVRTPTAMAYITLVTVAGLMFGKKGLMSTTGLSSLMLFILIYAENTGWLPPADFTVTITQWVTYTVLIGFTANIILTAKEISDEFLERARREIDLRKKSEETLKLFSRAIEHNPASIVITDINGHIVNINPEFTRLTGYTKEEVYGQNPRILKSGKHTAMFYRNLWSTILSGKVWHGILHNKKKDGNLYWEDASISPVLNEAGEITHFVAIKVDITARRQSEKDLRKANKLLTNQIQKNESLQTSLREQAIRDSLTGLHNRRYMDEILKNEYSRAKREGYPVSLVLMDMDKLKTINDTGGHILGDQAIRRMANHLKAYTRASDTVCRLGGDEFAIIMPKTSAHDALKRAEDWNKKISDITLLHIDNKTLHITFTAGIAAYPDHGRTMEEALNYADVALYRAKVKGRNRVELFEP